MESIRFDDGRYEIRTCCMEGKELTYRAFENIYYCSRPADEIQKLNIYVPELYYQGGQVGPYNRENAPIFMPNTVGGYMAGPSDQPGKDRFGRPNSIFMALYHGYVVVSAGIRGRTTGKVNTEFFEGTKSDYVGENTGRMTGRAPALLVDMKAAVRYLRHNRDRIPGDTERIITNGTSAGGALSAMTGASGNSADFIPYLKAVGAADERDDIFAASCYCPIHNLEHADMAYEWQFCGENSFFRTKHQKTENGVIRVPFTGEMTPKQIEVSEKLKTLFPSYVNGLGLKAENGETLSLEEDGRGSFLDYVKGKVIESAQKELDTHTTKETLAWLMVQGSDVEAMDCFTVSGGRITEADWKAYIRKITRMKAAPAFDALDLKSPENDEFGNECIEARHFSEFSFHNSEVNGLMAEEQIIRMINPLTYIGEADTAKHWRIRHGSFDRDTSLAIPVILSLSLKNKGYDTDFFLPWGLPHSGDYDLEELFAWIDRIV